MARPWRRLRTFAIAAACLMFVASAMTASAAQSAPATPKPLQILQMNLCDSGIARCYTGRSVAEAAGVIRADGPDVVTLNEVCRDDVYALERALAEVSDGVVVSAFQAANDRWTGDAYHCRNGQPYGIGLLVHVAKAYRGYLTYSGIYPMQDPGDTEDRAWLCLDAIGNLYACTTHLSNTSRSVALAQCAYLLHTAIPDVRARNVGYEPTVVGGDFNLGSAGPQDVQACLPSGYARHGDGGVQYVLATIDFSLTSDRSIGMNGTTDHPGLLVALTTP